MGSKAAKGKTPIFMPSYKLRLKVIRLKSLALSNIAFSNTLLIKAALKYSKYQPIKGFIG